MIKFLLEDICSLQVDFIVNPTDTRLSGSGGVDYLIHQRAGKGLKKACQEIAACPMGEAVLTEGFELASKHIIHTAVPKWSKQSQDAAYLLASCYVNSLDIAKSQEAYGVGFVAMGTGTNGFSAEDAAQIAVSAVWNWLKCAEGRTPDVIFAFTSEDMRSLYQKQMYLRIIQSFKEICSPASLAVLLKNTMPFFFEERGGMVKLPEEKSALTDLYQDQFYQVHYGYSRYMDILYQLIDKPSYQEVVSCGFKRCGVTANGIDDFMNHLEQMTFEECICFIVSLQRMDYASGGMTATHLRNCMNGNVEKVLEHMERLLRNKDI